MDNTTNCTEDDFSSEYFVCRVDQVDINSNSTSVINATAAVYLVAPKFTTSSLVRVVVLSIIATISLIGNAATLVSIARMGRKVRSYLYILLAHLFVSDLLVTLFCVIVEAAWTYTVMWRAGEVLCKLVKYMQMFSLYLSTFILVAIGYDQYRNLKYPMNREENKVIIRRMVIGVWIFSAVISSPQIFIFRVQRGPFEEEFYQCVTYGFYSAQWQEQLYTTISLVLMFVLPLFTLITTYICTFYTISIQRSLFLPEKEEGFPERSRTPMDDARRKLLHKAKMKSLMITVVIVLAFIVCWTPYYCMMIIFIFLDPDPELTEELQAGIFFFGSSTAMINPLIYGVFHLRRQPPSRMSRQFNSSVTSRAADNSVILVTYRNKSRCTNDQFSSRHGDHHHMMKTTSGIKANCCNGGTVNSKNVADGHPVVRLKYSTSSNGYLKHGGSTTATKQPNCAKGETDSDEDGETMGTPNCPIWCAGCFCGEGTSAGGGCIPKGEVLFRTTAAQ